MSVPDQYALRGGINYNIAHTGVGVALGVRFEGVPLKDLFGGSNGFSRLVHVMAAESGLNYMKIDFLSFSQFWKHFFLTARKM